MTSQRTIKGRRQVHSPSASEPRFNAVGVTIGRAHAEPEAEVLIPTEQRRRFRGDRRGLPPGAAERHYDARVSEEVRRAPADEADADEVWQRLTDEPDIRDVESWTDSEVDGWVVEVPAQEFFRQDPLGTELRRRMEAALRAVPRVTYVGERDNESWSVRGNPSGQALTKAATDVLDHLADRLRAGMLAP